MGNARFGASSRPRRRFARGDEEGGEAELQALTESRYSLVVSSAWLQLTALAVRRGDFSAAMDACDRGIAAATKNEAARTAASTFLLPQLVAERAFVLAATDRDAEASAEMARLAETYPAYPRQAWAELRTSLVRRVRRGDLAGAARLVTHDIEDVSLSLHEEALADVVRAAMLPELSGVGERERLQQDLRRDAQLRSWLEATAPAALHAFAAIEHGAELSTV